MMGLKNNKPTDFYIEAFIKEYQFVPKKIIIDILKKFGFRQKECNYIFTSLELYSHVFYDRKEQFFFTDDITFISNRNMNHYRAALELIVWFIDQVDTHYPLSAAFSPGIVAMSIDGIIYEVIYVEKGKAQYIDKVLLACQAEMLHRLESAVFEGDLEEKGIIINSIQYFLIMEDIEEVDLIQSKRVKFFCEMVDGLPSFYEMQTDAQEEEV